MMLFVLSDVMSASALPCMAVTIEEASVLLVCHGHHHLTGFLFPSPATSSDTFSLDAGSFSFQTVLTEARVADGGIWGGEIDISLLSLHVSASLKSLFYYLHSSSGNASVLDSQDTRTTEAEKDMSSWRKC